MISDFESRFDSFFNARCDQNSYLASKGYRSEGDRTLWEPQYEVDLEPEAVRYGPGAASVGELLDDFYIHNDEPDLGYEEFDADVF